MKNFKIIILIILSGMLAITSFQCIYPIFSHKMDYKSPTKIISVEYNYNLSYPYTRNEVRKKIENIVNVKHYLYFEYSMKDADGRAVQIIRSVFLNKDTNLNKYIQDICHELIHIKYNTFNERFVQFKTFEYLYNSEFIELAINMIVEMQHGLYPYEYDCYQQIVEFLEKEQNYES